MYFLSKYLLKYIFAKLKIEHQITIEFNTNIKT
jgi:hypothetical protein